MDHLAETKEMAKSVYGVSLDSIQMALALTVALAWYAFVKGCIGIVWKDRGDKVWILGAYAIIITIIFVGVLAFMKKILKVEVNARPIVHALTQSSL